MCRDLKSLSICRIFAIQNLERQNEFKARLGHDDVSKESKFFVKCCFKFYEPFNQDSLAFCNKRGIFSFIDPRTFCLVPIIHVGASAGTIRAVPDTVLKVPGLAPVLFHACKKRDSCF